MRNVLSSLSKILILVFKSQSARDFFTSFQSKVYSRDLLKITAGILGIKDYEIFLINNIITFFLKIKLSRAVILLEKNIPAAYILNQASFCQTDFYVNKNVLIPRPETEEMTYYILNSKLIERGNTVMTDIGTGSGNIAISLKKHFPENRVNAVEKSIKALNIAKKNAKKILNPKNRINFIRGDIFTPKTIRQTGPADIIISNPPYIAFHDVHVDPSVKEHEPAAALYADDDGMNFYNKLPAVLPALLNPGGALILEINAFKSANFFFLHKYFKKHYIIKDINHKERIFFGADYVRTS